MIYHVKFTEQARKTLSKMDKHTQAFIISWIRKNLEGCENPRQHGKSLVANRSGQWRYRVGDYRLIAEIMDNELVILMVNFGHRRDIYKN